jgi:hypothetical protein
LHHAPRHSEGSDECADLYLLRDAVRQAVLEGGELVDDVTDDGVGQVELGDEETELGDDVVQSVAVLADSLRTSGEGEGRRDPPSGGRSSSRRRSS